jgi:hypothetical protein
MSVPEAAQSAADRLGCSLNFVRLHWGDHVCLDSRRYVSRCLMTDPERHDEVTSLLSGRPFATPDTPRDTGH